MSENIEETVELKGSQLKYLDQIVKKYNLPDRSKAVRCLLNFAIQQSEHEKAIFEEIRCRDC